MSARLAMTPLVFVLLLAAPAAAQEQGRDQQTREDEVGDEQVEGEPILVQPDGPAPQREAPGMGAANPPQPDERAQAPDNAPPAQRAEPAPQRNAPPDQQIEPRRNRGRQIEPENYEPENYEPGEAYWSPYLSLEGRFSDDRNIGTFDLLAPITQGPDWMLFADLRGRFDDDDNLQGNFGLGFRRIMDAGAGAGGDNGWILGVYGFGDIINTDADNTYFQFALGAEALFKNWRARANGYIPLSDEERLDAGSTARAVLDGNAIRIQTTQVFEQPLPGFDAELGYRLPIEDQQFWVYAGYYYFADSGYDDISGPRLRGEWITYLGDTDLLPTGSQAVIGAEYLHDDVRDSQVFGTLALRVPFGEANRSIESGNYSENWRKWAMLARIQREAGPMIATREDTVDQPAVDPMTGEQMELFFVDGNGSGTASGTRAAPLTLAQAEQAAGPSDIFFLLGGDGSINAANTANGTLSLQPRQQVRGVGEGSVAVIPLPTQPVEGDFALRIASDAGRPTLTNSIATNNVINLANGATVQGLAVTNGATGINADGLPGDAAINLRQLAIRDTANDAVSLQNLGERTVVLAGLDLDDTGEVGGARGGGVRLQNNPDATFLVAGLDIATENGPGLVAADSGTINNIGAGPAINANGGPAIDIANTTGQINGEPGFRFQSLVSTDSTTQGVRLVDITEDVLVPGDTTVTNAAAEGVLVQNFDGNVRFARINVNGATDGIRLAGSADSTGSFIVGPLPPMDPQAPFNAVAGDGGIIRNVSGDAVHIASAPAASLNFLSIDATAGDDGVQAVSTGSAAPTIVLRGSEIRAAGQGVELDANGIADLTATVLGNSINSAGNAVAANDDGSGGSVRLALRNNTLASQNQRAVNITGSAPGSAIITRFDNNTINPSAGGILIENALFDADPAAGGIQAVPGGSTSIARATFRTSGAGLELRNVAGELAFDQLNIFNDGGPGLLVRPTAGGFALGVGGGRIDTTNGAALDITGAALDASFDRVASTGSAGAGVILDSVNGRLFIDQADIAGPGGDGIRVINSQINIRINGAEITNAGIAGIALIDNTGAFDIGNATITNPGGDAITATASGQDVLTLRIDAAEITGAAGDGIALLNQTTAGGALNATIAGNSIAAAGTPFLATSAGNGGTFNLDLRGNNTNGVYRLDNNGDTFNFAGELGQGMTFSGNLNGNVAENGNTTNNDPPTVNATGDFTIVAPDSIPNP